jgi:hypothetical protein
MASFDNLFADKGHLIGGDKSGHGLAASTQQVYRGAGFSPAIPAPASSWSMSVPVPKAHPTPPRGGFKFSDYYKMEEEWNELRIERGMPPLSKQEMVRLAEQAMVPHPPADPPRAGLILKARREEEQQERHEQKDMYENDVNVVSPFSAFSPSPALSGPTVARRDPPSSSPPPAEDDKYSATGVWTKKPGATSLSDDVDMMSTTAGTAPSDWDTTSIISGTSKIGMREDKGIWEKEVRDIQEDEVDWGGSDVEMDEAEKVGGGGGSSSCVASRSHAEGVAAKGGGKGSGGKGTVATRTGGRGKMVGSDDESDEKLNHPAGKDGMVTSVGSRETKCRSNVTRSSGRKRVKKENHIEYLKKKLGDKFDENFGKIEVHEHPNVVPAGGAKGEGVRLITEETDKAKVAKTIVSIAGFRKMDIIGKLFQPDEDIDYEQKLMNIDVGAIESRITDRSKDFCIACSKYNLWGHRGSAQHKQQLLWHSQCDALMGPTEAVRPYCAGYKTQDNVLCDKKLSSFWGSNVMSMGAVATRILQRKGLNLKYGDKKGYVVNGDKIKGASLAFVEFAAGTGKYNDEKKGYRLRWPHQLPCNLTDAKLPDASWWPVVAVSFDGDEQWQYDVKGLWSDDDDHEPLILWEFEEEEWVDERTRVVFRCRVLWICCQEQLQWDLPVAWPFPLRSRM